MSNAHNVESFRAVVLASLPVELRSRFYAIAQAVRVTLDSKESAQHRILEDVLTAERTLTGLGFNAYRIGCQVEVLMAPKPVEERCEGCGAPHAYACECRDHAAE